MAKGAFKNSIPKIIDAGYYHGILTCVLVLTMGEKTLAQFTVTQTPALALY